MNDGLDDNTITKIRNIVLSHTGIFFDDLHINDLVRHISSVCTDLKISNKTCIEQIDDSSFLTKFLEILINYITIGETYFFRDNNLFLYLRDYLLPDLIQIRRKEKKLYLRIWSAACSSGEEPYSLAMLLRYLLFDLEDWDIFLMATDINQKKLDNAQEGIYSRWSFRNDPIIPVDSFFSRMHDNQVKIDDSVRSMVRFERINLVRDTTFSHAFGPSSLDLILCRNVLMYFSPDKSHEVVAHLVNSLRFGGFLIVSPQEIGIIQGHGTRMLKKGSVFLHEKINPGSKTEVSDPSCISSDNNTIIDFSPENELPEEDNFDVLDIIDYPEGIQLIEKPEPGINLSGTLVHENEDPLFNQLITDNLLDEAGRIILQSGYDYTPLLVKQMEIIIRAYAGNGEYDKALGWSDRLIAVDVLNPRPYLLKAAILDEQGLFNNSLQLLRQSLYAYHDYLPAHLAIAGIYSKTGKLDLARHHYEMAISILEAKDEDTILEETEGIPAQKMKDMINMLLRER